MMYHKQTINHEPEKGLYGDCFRTSIACILDKDPLDVPHFYDYDPVTETPELIEKSDLKMHSYLNDQGVKLIRISWGGGDSMDGILDLCDKMFNGLIYMLSGRSETSKKVPCNHVVICQGNKMIHDVSNNHYGLIGPCMEDIWQTEILVREA